MTDAQKSVLEALKARDTTTLAELVEITGKSKSNVSNLLNKLIQMNLATKEAYGIYRIKDYNPQSPLRTDAPREPDNEPRELIEHLQQEIEYMKSRVEFLEKALDQSQQLQAFSQKTIESQRLQLEESQQPKPLIARLKAVFVTE
ncbi:MAG: helix-turn-helix domain-containing protein [Candidatus Poribacteria bacterium]|jgi:DNA-binding transcriptional ArsR family regulator|nr:helix-turn-helix domain-containing protein [Candidatus Poribacteria bacterium]